MNLHITTTNTELTPDIEDSIREALMEFSEYIDPDKKVQVKIEEVKLNYRVQVMFTYNGMYIRADVKEKSMKRAINRAIQKIQRKIDKIEYKQSVRFSEDFGRMMNAEKKKEENKPHVTRRKSFFIKPMTEDEAILQMELLGHEFFMFFNGEIESMCLLYKRKDGNYGIIESLN